MTILVELIEFLRMLDSELYHYIKKFGLWIYIILFAIVFSKTAFVILTFLPGDSLVFASGTIAAVNHLNIQVLIALFFVATLLGDSHNFMLGRLLQKFSRKQSWIVRLIPAVAIDKARQFLAYYGRIAITFSRFVPLMRTMTPFISGYTNYSYARFLRYNLMGAVIWTSVWLGSGYALGNLDWVANNLMLTLGGISVIMFIPTIYGYLLQLKKRKKITHTL